MVVLSHVCEAPYRKPLVLEEVRDTDLCRKINEQILDDIDSFSIGAKTTLMSPSEGLHHEAVGAIIVRNNKTIRDIIVAECGDDNAPDIIADIIIGNVEREDTDPLLLMGTGSYVKEIHIPIVYGDYFFTEALLKLKGREFLPW